MVTSYSCDLAVQPDNGFYVYYVEAWDSLWDKYIENRGSQTVTLSSPNDKPFAIYYVQNNGDDDICLYKSSVAFTGDSISLPSLTLGYYMLLAIILEVALVVLFFYSKDNLKITLWLARLLPLPISYLIGHLIICGFQVISYSVMHDLPIIIFLSILIYLGFLCAVEIIRLRNELKSLTT